MKICANCLCIIYFSVEFFLKRKEFVILLDSRMERVNW